jgi:hypothetical protein
MNPRTRRQRRQRRKGRAVLSWALGAFKARALGKHPPAEVRRSVLCYETTVEGVFRGCSRNMRLTDKLLRTVFPKGFHVRSVSTFAVDRRIMRLKSYWQRRLAAGLDVPQMARDYWGI